MAHFEVVLAEAFVRDTLEGVVAHRLLEFWHLIQKLSAAAGALAPHDAALHARWKLSLLDNRGRAHRATSHG